MSDSLSLRYPDGLSTSGRTAGMLDPLFTDEEIPLSVDAGQSRAHSEKGGPSCRLQDGHAGSPVLTLAREGILENLE
ncbi:hypothetical protein [Streptomyces sp. 142MFCol3.1]|uniref:hypothetical protein n=1 Tax=Streptomyces sp. 142MFCol3.1 TaxID=1172179 RepID=UPI001319B92F|nr:hypothetical protein [Streptomyces sp. 142MFCol3.1]